MQLVIALLEHGADSNAVDTYGETPIFRAVQYRRDGALDALLAHGVDCKVVDHKNQSPLHRACAMGTAYAVRRLLDLGCDPFAVDSAGLTPLQAGELSNFTKGQFEIWSGLMILFRFDKGTYDAA
jgi:ankyrin repeat protein